MLAPMRHYTITIDRELCRGYAECVNIAPEVFGHDADERAVVLDPEGDKDENILDAARACPVDAITLVDEHGDQVWP
jgi:ferredoxin